MRGGTEGKIAPLVTVKVSQQMETATLLAEALLHTILQQGRELQVLLADSVALIILLLACQVLIATIHLHTPNLIEYDVHPSSGAHYAKVHF